jgi:ABC-type multidrug transport system fused ATPase/permease subunit
MAGSVRSNLLYANPEASEEELEEVLDLASLNPFVERLPRGLETEVGDGGVMLSEASASASPSPACSYYGPGCCCSTR